MTEFRFTAAKVSGQIINGSLSALSPSEGKKKIHLLAEKNQLTIKSIEKKSTFLYRVRKGTDKPIKGEQKAYSKKEVQEALSRMGYEVLSVNKSLFEFNAKPPTADIVTYVKISAELTRTEISLW